MLGWARMEEADRNFVRAGELLDRAEKLLPDDPSILLSRAVLHGRTGDYAKALGVLDRAAQPGGRGLGANELLEKGRLLDRLGRYGEAFAAFGEGKRLCRELAGSSMRQTENWLRPVFDMAEYNYADPFNGNDLVSETVRAGMPDYGFPAQQAFIERLHQRCHCTPTQLQTLVFSKYLTTVAHHPLGYLQEIWHNFHYFGLVGLLADPIATINQFFAMGTPVQHEVAPGLSLRNLRELRRQFSAATLLLMLLNALSTAVASMLFTLFLFGVPYLAWRARRRREALDRPLSVMAFLWFSFVGVSLVFSLVHFEARHALPILPAGCIGIVYVFSAARRLLRHRLAAQPSA